MSSDCQNASKEMTVLVRGSITLTEFRFQQSSPTSYSIISLEQGARDTGWSLTTILPQIYLFS